MVIIALSNVHFPPTNIEFQFEVLNSRLRTLNVVFDGSPLGILSTVKPFLLKMDFQKKCLMFSFSLKSQAHVGNLAHSSLEAVLRKKIT